MSLKWKKEKIRQLGTLLRTHSFDTVMIDKRRTVDWYCSSNGVTETADYYCGLCLIDLELELLSRYIC